MKKYGVGFVGVGDISGIYLKNLTGTFDNVEIIGVCDLIPEKAQRAVEQYGMKQYRDMYELFADPKVDIVLNITRPYQHYEVTKAALLAGKHVYSEKPLAATLEEATELVALATEKKLYLGGAPDTYLGAGFQTCRRIIDAGLIGTVTGANAWMKCRGHEVWHPDPDFYYKEGAGPILDMGPYYVTALINMLGAVDSVTGMTSIPYKQRTITSEKHYGETIDVEVPTTVCGIMRFKSGAVGTLTTSFDVTNVKGECVEVYGSEGTLYCPDPNNFGGPIYLQRRGDGERYELPLMYRYDENSRGLGISDMADAIANNRPMRAGWYQTLHALEVMLAFRKSSDAHHEIKIESDYERGPMLNAEKV